MIYWLYLLSIWNLCQCIKTYVFRAAGYWNAGGQQNVESMLTYLTEQYLRKLGAAPAAMVETPATGGNTIRLVCGRERFWYRNAVGCPK